MNKYRGWKSTWLLVRILHFYESIGLIQIPNPGYSDLFVICELQVLSVHKSIRNIQSLWFTHCHILVSHYYIQYLYDLYSSSISNIHGDSRPLPTERARPDVCAAAIGPPSSVAWKYRSCDWLQRISRTKTPRTGWKCEQIWEMLGICGSTHYNSWEYDGICGSAHSLKLDFWVSENYIISNTKVGLMTNMSIYSFGIWGRWTPECHVFFHCAHVSKQKASLTVECLDFMVQMMLQWDIVITLIFY